MFGPELRSRCGVLCVGPTIPTAVVAVSQAASASPQKPAFREIYQWLLPLIMFVDSHPWIDLKVVEYQYLRVPVISAFGTPGTREYSSHFSFWCFRYSLVLSHFSV